VKVVEDVRPLVWVMDGICERTVTDYQYSSESSASHIRWMWHNGGQSLITRVKVMASQGWSTGYRRTELESGLMEAEGALQVVLYWARAVKMGNKEIVECMDGATAPLLLARRRRWEHLALFAAQRSITMQSNKMVAMFS